ncbi:AraC family transcriptional regulator [Flavobacterium sp. HTF]|uniref:AraC family transcriptional regulator n=1 Tax=Flavobacterium sp. HTF TaxID=2170732 RepID=UPI000D5E46D7|nr:AraC family transcriptional regulator [Flavobacterium sp. HTF]PWB27370.1 AraC family transcriptional regulator [Flavobacterium sp. HTF]
MKNVNTYHKLPILDGLELLNAQNNTVSFPYHSHDTFNIALILKHTFDTKLIDKHLHAPAGTLSITNPFEVHATPCDWNTGNSFFTFYVAPDVMKMINKNKAVFFEEKIIYDENLFKEFYFLSQNFENKTYVEKKLLQLLETLVVNYGKSQNFKNKEINLFARFLDDQITEKFSLEVSARSFGMDKYKFLRLFKHETGLTPNNYVILKRIEKSKILLNDGFELLDVAIETGFYDAAHFSKKFREFTGVTPLQYKTS